MPAIFPSLKFYTLLSYFLIAPKGIMTWLELKDSFGTQIWTQTLRAKAWLRFERWGLHLNSGTNKIFIITQIQLISGYGGHTLGGKNCCP